MTTLLIPTIAILQAGSDAVRDNGKKTLSKIIEVIYIALIFIGWYFLDITHHDVIAYVLFRMSIYPVTYNLLRGLKWHYMGTTSIYDRVISFLYGPLVKWVIVLTAAVGVRELFA